MLRRSALAAVILLLSASSLQFHPFVGATPQIPLFGGVIVQTNMTALSTGVAAYPDNSLVVVGSTLEIVQLNSTAIKILPIDGLVLRYSPLGVYQWHAVADFGVRDFFEDVALHESGNIYVVGWTWTEAQDRLWGWVFKYTSSGTRLFALNISIPDAISLSFQGVTIENGHPIVVGFVQYSGEAFRPLIVELDGNGSIVAYKHFDLAMTFLEVTRSNSQGDYFMAGHFEASGCMWSAAVSSLTWLECPLPPTSRQLRGVTSLGGNPLAVGVNGNPNVAVIFKRDSNGELLWSRTYAPSSSLPYYGWAAASDASAAYVAVRNGSALIELVAFVSPGVLTGFILNWGQPTSIDSVKYKSNGDLEWSATYGDSVRIHFPGDLTVDSYPRLVVAGARADPVTLVINPIVIKYEGI